MPRISGLGDTSSVEQLIRDTAAGSIVPPDLAVAQARHESGLIQSKVGQAGEIGVFQLMPSTAAELGVDPSDLAQNIQGGIAYLARMYYLTGGGWRDALIAYNEGPGAWSAGHRYSQSQNYADAILSAAGMTGGP
jgi:soluble lytic murein transglycosylase-like protein